MQGIWISTEHEFSEQLKHLVAMAKQGDGWKKYAWRRAKELEKEEHGMYRDMCKALTERMTINQGA